MFNVLLTWGKKNEGTKVVLQYYLLIEEILISQNKKYFKIKGLVLLGMSERRMINQLFILCKDIC